MKAQNLPDTSRNMENKNKAKQQKKRVQIT